MLGRLVLGAIQEAKRLEYESLPCVDKMMISSAFFYHDCYVKRDDIWLIEGTGYDPVREQMESCKDRSGIKLTASMWMGFGASSIEA